MENVLTADAGPFVNSNFKMEENVDFTPERLKAPFFLRCGALFIDYLVVVATPVIWLILTKVIGDSSSAMQLSKTGWIIAIIIAVSNLIALPAMWGKSIGKMLTGLTIVNMDGTPAGVARILLRNVIGYLLTLLTLGGGLLVGVINSKGRTLHDLVSGTIVVGGRKKLI